MLDIWRQALEAVDNNEEWCEPWNSSKEGFV